MTNKEIIRTLVKTREDIQKLRIRASNRLKIDADGESVKTTSETIATNNQLMAELTLVLDFKDKEKKIDGMISRYLKDIPIFKEFFKPTKGVGPQMAAVMISEFNIEIADTVSKMWQYAGMNPGSVLGKIVKTDKNGNVTIITTDVKVRGDKLTKGYVCPYNKFLKTKLLGVLADSFIKSNSPYRKYYDDYKYRLHNSSQITSTGKMWKEESDLHIHNASKRYMVKMFIKDLYVKWRTIEGLTVRPSYQEQYLGHTHHTSDDYIVDDPMED